MLRTPTSIGTVKMPTVPTISLTVSHKYLQKKLQRGLTFADPEHDCEFVWASDIDTLVASVLDKSTSQHELAETRQHLQQLLMHVGHNAFSNAWFGGDEYIPNNH